MNGLRVLGSAVPFPIASMGAGVLALLVLDLTGVEGLWREIAGVLAFYGTLTGLYARQWYRSRRREAAE